MKTLAVLVMIFGLVAQAKNASCTAMAANKLEASTNPPTNNPSGYVAPKPTIKANAKR